MNFKCIAKFIALISKLNNYSYEVELAKLKHVNLSSSEEDKSVVDKTFVEESAYATDLSLTGQWAEAFGKSHPHFATLFSKMLVAIAYYKVITDKNGKPLHYVCLEANDAFERITGIKRKDYLGKKATDLWLTNGSNLHKVIDTYGRVSFAQESLQFEYQMVQRFCLQRRKRLFCHDIRRHFRTQTNGRGTPSRSKIQSWSN
jgi:PAS domain-containing protein